MLSAPTVSVIIPTYNRADLLAEAIQSVVAETAPVHEIVVVDDGSTDSTPELLDDLAGRVCNLHCFNTNGLVPEGPFLGTEVVYGGRILGEMLEEPIVVPSTMMVSRAVFDSLGPFTSGVIVEDYEFI